MRCRGVYWKLMQVSRWCWEEMLEAGGEGIPACETRFPTSVLSIRVGLSVVRGRAT